MVESRLKENAEYIKGMFYPNNTKIYNNHIKIIIEDPDITGNRVKPSDNEILNLEKSKEKKILLSDN